MIFVPYILAALAAGGFWLWDRVTISSLRSEVSSLQQQIDDPMTGWRRQLAVCVGNNKNYDDAFKEVNTRLDDLGKKTDAVVAGQVQVGRQAAKDGQTTRNVVMDILSRPVPGVTTCDRALVIQREPLP